MCSRDEKWCEIDYIYVKLIAIILIDNNFNFTTAPWVEVRFGLCVPHPELKTICCINLTLQDAGQNLDIQNITDFKLLAALFIFVN